MRVQLVNSKVARLYWLL